MQKKPVLLSGVAVVKFDRTLSGQGRAPLNQHGYFLSYPVKPQALGMDPLQGAILPISYSIKSSLHNN